MNRKSAELVYSPIYDLSDYTHVISAGKYRQLYDALKFSRWNWNEPVAVTKEQLLLAHTERYLKDFLGARLSEQTQRAEIPIDERIEKVIVLDDDQWLDAEPYHDRFQWTQKWPRANWTLAYQGNLHEVPQEDMDLLLADMKAARAKPVSAN